MHIGVMRSSTTRGCTINSLTSGRRPPEIGSNPRHDQILSFHTGRSVNAVASTGRRRIDIPEPTGTCGSHPCSASTDLCRPPDSAKNIPERFPGTSASNANGGIRWVFDRLCGIFGGSRAGAPPAFPRIGDIRLPCPCPSARFRRLDGPGPAGAAKAGPDCDAKPGREWRCAGSSAGSEHQTTNLGVGGSNPPRRAISDQNRELWPEPNRSPITRCSSRLSQPIFPLYPLVCRRSQ